MMCRSVIPKILVCFYVFSNFIYGSHCFVLRTYISQYGLHGEFEFSFKNESATTIRTNLNPTLQYPDQIWRWSIHELPVDYRDVTEDRCSDARLGKLIYDFTDDHGYLVIPGKDHTEFESSIPLIGPSGLWDKSLVLRTIEQDRVICGTIMPIDSSFEEMMVAHFKGPLGGSIYMKWLYASPIDGYDALVWADLYHTKGIKSQQEYTEHKWKMFVTDIFDDKKRNYEEDCEVLQLVFNPHNNAEGMSVGDLDAHLGPIRIAKDPNVKKNVEVYRDSSLKGLRNELDTVTRGIYIVVYDNKRTDRFLSCAKLEPVMPYFGKALINMDGARGTVEFSQRSIFHPTWAKFEVLTSDGDYENSVRFVSSIDTYSVFELPVKMAMEETEKVCEGAGSLYNPLELPVQDVPPPGLGTQDQYPVGDLLGKYKNRVDYLIHKYLLPGISNELAGSYWDVYLPLSGSYSIMHRSLVIQKNKQTSMICGTIRHFSHKTQTEMEMLSAVITFRYPITGRILMRQPVGINNADTTIIVEDLMHADGTQVNTTREHRWSVMEKGPGADYYNWSARCQSAGRMFDPFKIDINTRYPEEYCKIGLEGLCRIGDLTTRHGSLTIAGRKVDAPKTSRRLFTDSVVSLAGKQTVIHRALVIHDDHGPVARGDRLACSIISRMHRRKGVISNWFSNGDPISLAGKVEMVQQSEYDTNNIHVTIDGLDDVSAYKVHSNPLQMDLSFPCDNSSVSDVLNPLFIQHAPLPTLGTSDQYAYGDLSSKFGGWDNYKKVSTYLNDTHLSLFGMYSVIGRSLVLYTKSKKRWACANIEAGYAPSEAQELRAIASFHIAGRHPWGYVRLRQLVYADGAPGDTYLEVNLKYTNARGRNATYDHNWAVFVNPVGVDGYVNRDAKCVSAGYVWNPFYTQLADPLNDELYKAECGPDNQLRCYVGDLYNKLGPLTVGGGAMALTDGNLPLSGPGNVLGRSLVIYDPSFSPDKMACANIEPDHDLVKYVNVIRSPKFTTSQFMADVRQVLGAPEWMVSLEARKTRLVHSDGCVQMLVHFRGPKAHQLEQDFSRLIVGGRVELPVIFQLGLRNTKRPKSVGYRQCGTADPLDRKRNKYKGSSTSASWVVHACVRLLCCSLLLVNIL